jgi:hypothetical protein
METTAVNLPSEPSEIAHVYRTPSDSASPWNRVVIIMLRGTKPEVRATASDITRRRADLKSPAVRARSTLRLRRFGVARSHRQSRSVSLCSGSGWGCGSRCCALVREYVIAHFTKRGALHMLSSSCERDPRHHGSAGPSRSLRQCYCRSRISRTFSANCANVNGFPSRSTPRSSRP